MTRKQTRKIYLPSASENKRDLHALAKNMLEHAKSSESNENKRELTRYTIMSKHVQPRNNANQHTPTQPRILPSILIARAKL